jgi:error-prone DNA polymerase
LRREAGERFVAERERAPFASLQDLVDRAGARRDELQRLAEIGALASFGLTRRAALWQIERASRPVGPLFRGVEPEDDGPSPLPEMTYAERLAIDLAGAGVTVGKHPLALHRSALRARGIKSAADLTSLRDGARAAVAGAVICRQRPGTAKGFLFLTLEDETGLANIIVRPGLFERFKPTLVSASVLEVVGRVQAREGLSLRAEEIRPLSTNMSVPSRDFR